MKAQRVEPTSLPLLACLVELFPDQHPKLLSWLKAEGYRTQVSHSSPKSMLPKPVADPSVLGGRNEQKSSSSSYPEAAPHSPSRPALKKPSRQRQHKARPYTYSKEMWAEGLSGEGNRNWDQFLKRSKLLSEALTEFTCSSQPITREYIACEVLDFIEADNYPRIVFYIPRVDPQGNDEALISIRMANAVRNYLIAIDQISKEEIEAILKECK